MQIFYPKYESFMPALYIVPFLTPFADYCMDVIQTHYKKECVTLLPDTWEPHGSIRQD